MSRELNVIKTRIIATGSLYNEEDSLKNNKLDAALVSLMEKQADGSFKTITATKISKEKLRQSKVSFELKRTHIIRMNCLKLIMGYVSIVVLIIVLFFCVIILWNSNDFKDIVVISAAFAFFGDFISLIFLTYSLVFKANQELTPFIEN